MWEPADLNALPSPLELAHANIAIKMTEQALQVALRVLADAQRGVADLEKDLARRRAWVAPIRRLTSDVLSLIFEFCGEDQWKTTLRISEVSRQWRSLVLATPRAWEFLDIRGLRKEEHHVVYRFLQRSGQRPLHIYLPGSMPTRLLYHVENRLKCLSVMNMHGVSEDSVFPILERLTIHGRSDQATSEISYFNDTRFPSLRHLLCESYLECTIGDSVGVKPWSCPPLQSLSLQMTEDPAWVDLLRACRSTLISLTLHHANYFPEELPKIALPALKCLEISYNSDEQEVWPLDLTTPALECYLETDTEVHDWPYHWDTSTVKNVRLDHLPVLSLFPALEVLQLQGGQDTSALFSRLASNNTLSPNLKRVEIESYRGRLIQSPGSGLKEITLHRNTPIEFVARRELPDLPYAITNSPCGEDMPCNDGPCRRMHNVWVTDNGGTLRRYR